MPNVSIAVHTHRTICWQIVSGSRIWANTWFVKKSVDIPLHSRDLRNDLQPTVWYSTKLESVSIDLKRNRVHSLKQRIEGDDLITSFHSLPVTRYVRHDGVIRQSIHMFTMCNVTAAAVTVICARDNSLFQRHHFVSYKLKYTRDYASALDCCLQSVIRIDFGDNNTGRLNNCQIRCEQIL